MTEDTDRAQLFERLNKALLAIHVCIDVQAVKYLTLLGAWGLPQSMYSPTDIDFCYRQGKMVSRGFGLTYSAHETVPLELNTYQEGGSVEEEHVSFPVPWIVVRLGIDCSWHGPNSSSTHYFYF